MGLRVRTVLTLLVAVVPTAAVVGVWTSLVFASGDEGIWLTWVLGLLPALLLLGFVVLRAFRGAGTEVERPGAPIHEAVARMSEQVGLRRRPAVRIVRGVPPNLWIEGWALGRLTICIEEGLAERLPADRQAALAAHELAHLVHHDARWMTLADAPGRTTIGTANALMDTGGRGVALGALLWLPGQVLRLVALPFSRTRELLADETAARIVGDPLLVARALQDVSGALAQIPTRDLRRAAARDAIHLLPARREAQRGIRRIAATHPRLEDRVARLEALAAALEADRRRR